MREAVTFTPGSLHRYIQPREHGTARIVHDRPDALTKIRAAIHGQSLDCDVYTRLIVNNEVWMTDADFEWRTNIKPVTQAKGDVLIAGLGLGFIVLPILARDQVSSVTILENNHDVIAITGPQITNDKLKIIKADSYAWEPPKKAFDSIYLDIWENVPNSDDWEDIKSLKKKYRPALRKGGWIAAWCEQEARR